MMSSRPGSSGAEPRVYLKVPFADKEAAKGLGARWCGNSKMWYTTPKEQAKFAKWPVVAVKAAPAVTPAAPAAPLLPPPEVLQALGSKKDYTLVPPPGAGAEVTPIPSMPLYKLKLKTTADLAKIISALEITLPMGLDVDELIELLMKHPEKFHIDKTAAPTVTLKPLRELTEHELIMQKIKANKEAEERAKRLREKGDVINPEPGTGYVAKKPKTGGSSTGVRKERAAPEEMSEEKRELLARLADDDYDTIR